MNNFVPPAGNMPQTPESKSRKTLIIILVIVIAFLLMAVGLLAGYYISLSIATRNQGNSTAGLPVVTYTTSTPDTVSSTPTATETATSSLPTSTPKINLDVTWNAPKLISSLKLFQAATTTDPNAMGSGFNPETGAKYYQVGTISSGQYQGGKIILVSAPYDGPATYPGFYRFIELPGSIVLLKNNSDQLSNGSGADNSKFTVDETYNLTQLDFPKSIPTTKSGETLELDPYVRALFSLKNLKLAFTSPTYGKVYTSAASDPTNADLFRRDGFYIQAPDGTVEVYALKPDFVDQTKGTQVTWSDGSQNKADYTYTDHTGCGSANYASVMTASEVNVNGLQIIGQTSKGDSVYGFKDTNNAMLKDIYNNKYQVLEGQTKVSYAVFLANHPIFFWRDSFGRLIRFENSAYGPMVECGKPVIYLYPISDQKVSVQVEPQGGMTYSDPAYNGGWNVFATTDSQLTELATGKPYPYLFWEGRGGIYQQPQKGFVIKQAEVHTFLVEKLAQLGLNAKETSDFIEFWEPRMQGSPYYFVSFLGNREMDQIAPLTINPKPDTIIRILMDFSPLAKPIKVEGYDIKTPVRSGFTAVEWGGVLR